MVEKVKIVECFIRVADLSAEALVKADNQQAALTEGWGSPQRLSTRAAK